MVKKSSLSKANPQSPNSPTCAKPEIIKRWEPSDEKEVTPVLINLILRGIKFGTTYPVVSQRILQYFLDSTEGQCNTLSPELIEFLRYGIAAYVKNPKIGELEKGLGLRNPKKRPTIMLDRNIQISQHILRLLLMGCKLGKASISIAKEYSLEPNKIEEIWRINKKDALWTEWFSRGIPCNQPTWSVAEIEHLKRIYKSEENINFSP